MADLDALETFVTAVRTGSFAAAARALGVTPAMIGRRIQALEAHYGTRLIERTTRAQRLTEAGDAFLRHAETVLDAAAELDDAMSSAPGRLEGRIRMTGPATLGVSRLAEIVARFQSANPAVTVEMVLSDRRMDLIADGFDFAVRIGELPSSSMIARRIGTYALVLVASPAFIAREGAPAERPAVARRHVEVEEAPGTGEIAGMRRGAFAGDEGGARDKHQRIGADAARDHAGTGQF
ncbi:MAG: LysR family transcriptional regulator, partial [Hyphomicrobiales bacterium]